MSSKVYIDNIKDILILGKDLDQGLDNTKLTAERQYAINFSEQLKKSCFLSLRYNKENRYLFVNGA